MNWQNCLYMGQYFTFYSAKNPQYQKSSSKSTKRQSKSDKIRPQKHFIHQTLKLKNLLKSLRDWRKNISINHKRKGVMWVRQETCWKKGKRIHKHKNVLKTEKNFSKTIFYSQSIKFQSRMNELLFIHTIWVVCH